MGHEFGEISNVILDILLSSGFIFLTVLLNSWFQPLGGAIYSILSLPVIIPYIGRIYRILLTDGILQLSFLFKFIGYLFSSCGAIFPIIFLQNFHPAWLSYPPVLWGLFLGALIVGFNIMHDVHLMRTQSFSMIFSKIKSNAMLGRFSNDISDLDDASLKRLARSHFSDMAAIRLLSLGVSYSVVCYTGSILNLFSSGDSEKDPIETLTGVLAIFSIFSGESLEIQGSILGIIINAFYGLSLFFFLTFFVALASELIDVPAARERPTQDD